MSPTHVPETSDPAATARRLAAAHPHVIAAAGVDDVMRDQLEYLIEHAKGGSCGCALCQRYQRARTLLLEIFG